MVGVGQRISDSECLDSARSAVGQLWLSWVASDEFFRTYCARVIFRIGCVSFRQVRKTEVKMTSR